MDSIYIKRNKKGKKKIGRKILFLLVLGAIIFGSIKGCQYTIRSIKGIELIKIKEIKVKGPSTFVPQEIINLSGINKGDSILGISINEAKAKISKHKWVKKVRIRRSLPSTIIIELSPKKVGALALRNNSIYYIDEDGKIIDQLIPGYEPDHPIIIAKQESYPKILSVIRSLKKLEPISEVSLEQDVMTIYSSKLSTRVKLDINNIPDGISKTFRVIEDINDRGETATTIDASLPGKRIVVMGIRKK